MNTRRWMLTLCFAAATFAMIAGFAGMTYGQQAETQKQSQPQRVPLVDDWSTHHMVFSNPGSFSDAMQGKSFTDWYKTQANPRFKMEQARREAVRAHRGGEQNASSSNDPLNIFNEDSATPEVSKKPPAPTKVKPQGDWSNYLGGTANAGMGAGLYPAKFAFDINATPDCTNDYVVVPVNKAPANQTNASGTITVAAAYCATPGEGVTINGFALTTAATDSSATATVRTQPTGGNTFVVGGITYTWHGTCGTNTYCVTHVTSTTTDASNLAGAINGSCDGAACTANPNVTATSSGAIVTLKSKCAGSAAAFTMSQTGTALTLSTVAAGSNGTTSGANFALGTSNTATATNIASAITTETTSTLTTGSAASGVVTVSANAGGAAGAGITLAQSFTSGVVVSGSTLTGGTDGQASLVALNNLYSGTGTDASQTGIVSSNGAVDGATVTINGVSTTASSAQTDATATITVAATVPASGSTVTIGSVTYAFSSSNLTVPASGCNVRAAPANNTTVAASLDGAITLTGTQGVGTFRCATSITTANPAVTAVLNSATISLTATTPGPTGFTFSETGTTNFSAFTYVPGAAGGDTATTFAYVGDTPTQLAADIAASINLNGTMGVTATSSGDQITVTATTAGLAGNSITVATTVSGFAWNGTTLAGGSGALCTGPTVKWAYKTSTAGAASPMLGSPTISPDGTKIAFIESATSGAILHVLRWKAGDGGTNLGASPFAPPTSTSTSATWASCLAGSTACMFNLTLGTNNNTNSPPFYDYQSDDTLYVGDNGGRLWKVTGVFYGTPAIAPSPWNAGVLVHAGAILTGPVYDINSGNILVGDSLGRLSYVTSAGVLGGTSLSNLGDIVDSPIMDGSTGQVFVFTGTTSTGALVEETTTSLGSATSVHVGGSSSSTTHLHLGTFDNIYYNSSNGTGNLYVCGKESGNDAPALYALPLSAGVLTGTAGTALDLATTTGAQECSPLTEFYNPNENSGVDWLFVGVPANCAFGGSAGGCIMAFDITSGTFPSTASATGAETSGTSGIIVDNVSTLSGASSVYFTTLGSQGAGGCNNESSSDSTFCVVKRTQQGLQ